MAEQELPGFPGLKVCVNEMKGRHLVVTRPCKSGELLLKQKPYASSLSEGQERCDYCMKPSVAGELQRCSKCKQARYCSREHQRQAWQVGGHAKECKALYAMHPRVPPPTVRLAARALWRAHGEAAQGEAAGSSMHSGFGTSAASEGGSWRDVQGLVHHWDGLEDSQKMLYAQMAALTRQLTLSGMENAAQVERDGMLPGVEEAALLLARLSANAHTICDEELRPVGSGLYPLASMANHSCQPSAMQSFDGDTMHFRALRPLAPGDEVTIAYVELAATRQDRREALFEQYAFDINAPLAANHSTSDIHAPPAGASCAIDTDTPATLRSTQQQAGTSDGVHQGSVPSGSTHQRSGSTHVEHEQQGAGQAPKAKRARTHITLRPPPLAEHRLDLGLPGGGDESSQLLARVYSLRPHPPWQCDPNDEALTQLVLVQQQGVPSSKIGSTAAPSSSSCPGAVDRGLVLPGGLQVHSLQVQPEEDPADSFGGFGGAGDEEAEGMLGTGGWTQQQQQQQQQQQRQRQRRHRQKRHVVQVDMWGPWAEASLTSMPPPAAGAPSSSTSPSSQGDHRGVTRGLQSHPPTMPKQEAQGGTATGPAGQQLHALSISDHQQRVETDTSAQRHAPSCHAHLSAYPQLHQQQQQQVDVGSLAAEVGALEALVVHAEALMAGCARSSHAQAVMLLTQGLARADRFAVRRAAPAAFAQGAPLSVPPTSADGDRSPVLVALGPLHALRIRLAATLMRAAVEEGSSWKIALQAACALTPIYEQLYPPVWPNLGLHLAQHAKLAMFLEHPAEAAQLADRALKVLSVTHSGPGGGGICEEVARIRWEAQQECGER